MSATAATSRSRRLASVDALRGITVAAMLLVNDAGDWGHVFWPLDHAHWHGATPTDFIFPMFLFIMGVAIALAITPRLEQGKPRAILCKAALWRAFRIVVFGLVINALAMWLLDRHMRWPGVLQRIGVCFAIAGVLAIYTAPRVWWACLIGVLGIYTITLHLGGTLAEWDNIADRIDTRVFGRHVYRWNAATGQGHDPEGLLSTLGALGTSLLGLCAGTWLRAGRIKWLAIGGVVLALVGWLWSWSMPFNKNLWTPTFVLWTAGWSTLLLVAFHWMMDVREWRPVGRRFGVNAIAAYGGSQIMAILMVGLGAKGAAYGALSGVITPWAGPYVASLVYALLFVLLWWIAVWVMDRRRWYLKI